jgi:hypothetical protein
MRPKATDDQASDIQKVRGQFERWRKNRTDRRIPQSLWDAAASLCGLHSIAEVSRALRLDYSDLKRRVEQRSEPSRNFGAEFVSVDLPAIMGQPEWDLEMERPNGLKMRIRFKGHVDPLRLAEALWRCG